MTRPRAVRVAFFLASICSIWPFASGAKPRASVNAEIGSELDTNARRDIGDETDAAPLMRLSVNGVVRFRAGRHLLGVSYGGGGKLYLTEKGRPADEIVQQASISWAAQLRRWAVVSLQGSYYDVFLRQGIRDFRSGRVFASLAARRDSTDASLLVGYRGVQLKPDNDYDPSSPQLLTSHDYDFHALQLGVDLRRQLTSGRGDATAEWTIGVSYMASVRAFEGDADILGPAAGAPCEPQNAYGSGENRRDLYQFAKLEVDYLGAAAATVWYSLELNSSNSYAESFVRHAVGIKFTTLLGWGIYLTTVGVLQFSHFREALYYYRDVQSEPQNVFDDENRSRLVLYLARDIGERFSIGLRYAMYLTESGAIESQDETCADEAVESPGYLRHTIFLGLRFDWDNEG